MKGEPCKRDRRVINGENFYFFTGETFVGATVPHENRKDRLDLRLTIDCVCDATTPKDKWDDPDKRSSLLNCIYGTTLEIMETISPDTA